MSAAALETVGAGKRYGSQWALRDCTLRIPSGSVAALLGPNGAGKTTLLHLAVGLTDPDAGEVRTLGHPPRREPESVLPRLGFVGQDHPLYRGFTLAETLRAGRELNPSWDEDVALERVESLRLPLDRKIGKLSGGQQAQVALTLALAKKPELLVLDEPVASLDPRARREFFQSVLEAVAETGMTVLLSSHIVSDLENVCDYLVVLSAACVRLAGPIEEIVAAHRVLTGPRSDAATVARLHQVVHASHTPRQTTLLVRANGHVYDSCWDIHPVGFEEVALAYFDTDDEADEAVSA
jgi:ABC-2 type transport system ATP-binding protein